jgi:hypothetical protein
VKINYPFYAVTMFSIACHAFVLARFFVYKLSEAWRRSSPTTSPASTSGLLHKINKESLFRYRGVMKE